MERSSRRGVQSSWRIPVEASESRLAVVNLWCGNLYGTGSKYSWVFLFQLLLSSSVLPVISAFSFSPQGSLLIGPFILLTCTTDFLP